VAIVVPLLLVMIHFVGKKIKYLADPNINITLNRLSLYIYVFIDSIFICEILRQISDAILMHIIIYYEITDIKSTEIEMLNF